MKKPYLYLFCGFPFAGKTTVARKMVSELGIRRVSIGGINNERGVWDNEKGLSPEEWSRTYQEAYRRIEAFLGQGESVIDDSANFTREQRDRGRAIAHTYDATAIVIYIDTPLAEVQRRWQANRHTAVRADVRDDDFAHVIAHFELPTEDEQVCRYDGTSSVEEWVALTFFREPEER